MMWKEHFVYSPTTIKLVLITAIFFHMLPFITTDSPIKQLHIVFRHGERAPTETYQNDPYRNFSWSGGWGQLTNRGKLQIYTLGTKLREYYNEFIPDYYLNTDVKMLSSYSERCLMSAEVLLAGLFPPKREQIWNNELLWQPIPVTYQPRNQDKLIAMKVACKKYDEERKTVMKSEEMQKINAENAELFKYLTENTGDLFDNIGSVELLYNTLEIEQLHNLTLPEWTKGVDFAQMKHLAALSLATFTKTTSMKRLKGGVFLSHVISLMKNTKKVPSLNLYSAHDISIVNIMRSLGEEELLKPNFGASLIVELRENAQISILYRDGLDSEARKIEIGNCTDCDLDRFEDILKPVLPIDWEKECTE